MKPRVQMPHWTPPLEPESALKRMQPLDTGPIRETGHGHDFLAAAATRRQESTPVDRPAIHDHGARAALGTVAAQVAVG